MDRLIRRGKSLTIVSEEELKSTDIDYGEASPQLKQYFDYTDHRDAKGHRTLWFRVKGNE